jgi:hypothetical protein
VRNPSLEIKLMSSPASGAESGELPVPRIADTPDCAHRAFLRIADVIVMHSLITSDIGLIEMEQDCVRDDDLGGIDGGGCARVAVAGDSIER